KKDYRHYNVKTVEGINDFATMKEVVYRRYRRLKEEESPFPQLVIIDGGKGQLNAAIEALTELDLLGEFSIIGLAKSEEELFFPGYMASIKRYYHSESFKHTRRIRDDVHRFWINLYRQKRNKGTFKNELYTSKGIGKYTADLSLKPSGSVKK